MAVNSSCQYFTRGRGQSILGLSLVTFARTVFFRLPVVSLANIDHSSLGSSRLGCDGNFNASTLFESDIIAMFVS
jgi:hypothetical protein